MAKRDDTPAIEDQSVPFEELLRWLKGFRVRGLPPGQTPEVDVMINEALAKWGPPEQDLS